MTATGTEMNTRDVSQMRRPATAADWGGVGWTDSSWELLHGLDVVEDLPPDAWPAELAPPAAVAGSQEVS